MGLANGILTAPFTKIAANGNGDLQKALETSVMSHISLCTHANINKWAKCKPVRHTSIGPLTDFERAGMVSDKQAGYIYGLLLRENANPWNLFTETNWFKYIAVPSGNPYPYRALDFDGYYKYAESSLKFSSNTGTVETERDGEALVSINFSPTNTRGIPYGQVVTEGNNDNNSTLGGMYYGVAVMDTQKTWCYAAVLRQATNKEVHPLYYRGYWDPMYVMPALGTIPELADITTETTCLVSFFIMHNQTLDMTGAFQEVDRYENLGLLWPVPFGTNIECKILVNADSRVPRAYISSYVVGSDQVTLQAAFQTAYEYAITMKITADLYNDAGVLLGNWDSGNFTVQPNAAIPTKVIDNLYLDYNILAGDTVTVDWLCSTRLASAGTWGKTGTGSFEFTAQ